jgi:adhesin/invasin
MLNTFMLARIFPSMPVRRSGEVARRFSPSVKISVAALASLSLVTIACQKVPLLAPTGSVITLSSAANALPLNGTTTLTAQVVQASGTAPQSGTHVNFTTTLGSIQPANPVTDLTGRVTVTFTAGTASGTATVMASSGGASASGNNAVKIAIGAAAVGKINVGANPSTLRSTGGTTTITATILDINGNVLPNLPVTFTTTAGTVNPTVVNTDQTGNAQTTLTTTLTATVTATAGAQGGGGTGGGGTGGGGGIGGGTPPPPTPIPTATSNSVTVNLNQSSAVTVGPASPATPFATQSVTFPLTYNTPTGSSPIDHIEVNFGDGTPLQKLPGKPPAISHAFNVPGSFSVQVTAVDVFGDFSSGAGSVTVTPKPIPVVTLAVSTTNPTAGVPVTFTITVNPAAGSGTVIQDVTLDFGDGNSKDLGPITGTTSPQHIYDQGGEKTVTVTATDSNGGTARQQTVLVVFDQAPLAVSLTFTKNGTLPNVVVSFTATVTPPPPGAVVAQYLWHFADGTPDQTTGGNQITHTYTAACTCVASVTITTTRGASTSGTATVVIP